MMREFCDICGDEIKDKDRHFSIGGSRTDRDDGYNNGREAFAVGREWLNFNYGYSAVDEKCYKRIRLLVAELKGELPRD